MKRLLFLFTFLLPLVYTFAQRKADIGVLGGATFYLGDVNQEKVFYKPGYNVGGIFRYNFNPRYSLRMRGTYTKISGSDNDFENTLVGRSPNTFSATIFNLSPQVEYNFFPYMTGDMKYKWSPYVFGGLGYSMMLASSSTNGVPAKNHFGIPFGFGFKVNLASRLSGGFEWTFNKTFSDRTDGVVPRVGENILFKNDWYNFVGLFITYKFFKFAVDCPAYN